MKNIDILLVAGLFLLAASCGTPSSKTVEDRFTDGVATALAADGQVDWAALQWTRDQQPDSDE